MNAQIIEYLTLFNKYGWFLLLVVLERIYQTRPIALTPRGWISDLIHAYDPWLKPFIIVSIVTYLSPKFSDATPLRGLFSTAPLWANLFILALISEVTFYFVHRLSHKYSFFWEFHRVHHSSTTYYSLMTYRFHPLDSLFFEWPYILLTAWLGVPFEALFFYGFFRGFMDRYGHSNINGPHWHGRIFATPHFHAWHHATEPAAFNKNFSRDFVFMDFIMGTAYDPKGRDAQEFGEPGYPTNFFVQMVYPFYCLWQRYAAPKPAPQPTADNNELPRSQPE